MFESRFLHGDSVGIPQEAFGAEIVESCHETALIHFFEAMNASMAPLLNAPGLAMLYAPDAVLQTDLPTISGLDRAICTGRAEIEEMFELLSLRMASVLHRETSRTVIGRKAFWSGSISGIRRQSGRKTRFDAVIRIDFDEEDRVRRQWTRITSPARPLTASGSPAEARKGPTSG